MTPRARVAATPFVSIAAERATRAIVRATERGTGEKILSVSGRSSGANSRFGS